MINIFKKQARKARDNAISMKHSAITLALTAFGALGIISAVIAVTILPNDVRVDVNADLTYYLSVREDGVDVNGVESSDTTRADIIGGRATVTDKLPEGLTFKGFVTTEDGTFGASARSDSSIRCAGKVVDDTNETSVTEGAWNADRSEFTYHGLHYDANTRTISFVAEKIQAGCELTVGIIATTPETIDDPTTSVVETRRDFYNNALISEGSLSSISNTVHAYIGNPDSTLHKVIYQYTGDIPNGTPEVPAEQKYAQNITVGVNANPTLEGYTFSGWTTADAAVNDGKFAMPGQDVVFVGIWTKNTNEATYSVTYIIDGKEMPLDYMPPKAKDYVAGSTVYLDSTEKDSVVDGYKFSGWATDDAGLSEIGFNMPEKNVTIRGSFERIGYMVCYEFMNQPQPANAGALLPACEKHYPGEKVTTALNPTADGYKFTGWYAKDEFTMPEKDVLIQGEWALQNGVFAPEISKQIVKAKNSYIYGETVDFKITVKNTADYEIKEVFVEEQLEGAVFTESSDNKYTVKTDTVAVIPSIAAGESVELYSSYKITKNEAAIIKNVVELTGAIADGNNDLDTSKEYKAEVSFNAEPEPITPTGVIISSLPYVGLIVVSGFASFALVLVSKKMNTVKNAKRLFVYIGKRASKVNYKIVVPCITMVGVILGGVVINMASAATYSEPIESIELTSQHASYANNEGGAWNVVKSAKWIEQGVARITFDLNTIAKFPERNIDIVMVLDNSGSMYGEKLERVKADASDLVNTILSDSNNRVGLVDFSSEATKLSDFTNDKETLLSDINALTAVGCTNYYSGLVKAEEILDGYQKQENRDLVLLFLTDGYPNEQTPNEIAQFQLLGQKYPYMTVNGIQYEMGEEVLDPIVSISDNQFIADMTSLNNVLLEASFTPYVYEDFMLTDYINNEYWNVEGADKFSATLGDVELEDEDGTPKVTWSIKGSLISGRSATLTIDVKLKDGIVITDDLLLPTNKKESIVSRLPKTPDENITSEKTPVLTARIKVTYEPNLPSGCDSYSGELPEERAYFPLSIVEKSDKTISCNGYIFKGWEFYEGAHKRINDDYFKLISEDVILRGTWVKSSIMKTMEGEVKEQVVAKLASGRTINEKFKGIASGKTSASYTSQNTNILAVKSADTMNNSQKETAVDISFMSPLPIYAWFEDGVIYIYSDADKIAGSGDMSYLFYNCPSLTNISALSGWDTGNVTNMSSMFNKASSLTDISALSDWNTGNVTNMSSMFNNASSLTNISALSGWDTSSVTGMSSMFDGASSLTDISALSDWNTGNVTNMSLMFRGNSKLTNLSGLENWNTGNVTNMSCMFNNFNNASSLTDISALSGWDTSSVKDMSGMFYYNSSLTNLSGLENWNTSSVTNMYSMFDGASSLNNISALSGWDISSVTDMSYVFSNASSLTDISALSGWDTSNVTNMSSMFYGNSSLTNLSGLENWNTSSVTGMFGMFSNASSLTDISALSDWNTGNVTNMSSMFNNASRLTDISALSGWDTGSVTGMSSMFDGASSLTDISALSDWNTGNVTNMSSMFNKASSLTNLSGLENWNTGNVTNMSYMFTKASSLNNISALSGWDTSSVTDMSYVFSNASSLTDISALSGWDTSSVTDMSSMFYDNSSLTDLSGLENWNTGNVMNMFNMFYNVPSSIPRPSWY